MFDTAEPQTDLQRAYGAARVRLGTGGVIDLAQRGAAKAFLPRVHRADPEAVFLNTSGGLTGGDRFSFALGLGPGAAASGTTQTAERVYRSAGGAAEVDVTLDVAEGASLAWLPQETILFDGARLRRRTVAKLTGAARLLFCEMVVLGRAAMGEVVRDLDFRDRREVWRDGVPLLIEPLYLSADALGRASHPSMLGGARALATVALVAPGAEDAVGAVRARLTEGAAVSGWDGKCVIRLIAPGARELRRGVAAALSILDDRPLPRVWQMGGV